MTHALVKNYLITRYNDVQKRTVHKYGGTGKHTTTSPESRKSFRQRLEGSFDQVHPETKGSRGKGLWDYQRER